MDTKTRPTEPTNLDPWGLAKIGLLTKEHAWTGLGHLYNIADVLLGLPLCPLIVGAGAVSDFDCVAYLWIPFPHLRCFVWPQR